VSQLIESQIDLRAVEAAEASALQAERAVDISIASAVVGIVALVALLITIAQGRAALRKAEAANKIASDTSKKQLRAYLSVESCGVQIPKEGWITVPLNIENLGATPASDIEIAGDVLVLSGDPREFDPATDGRLADKSLTSETMLGPNSNRYHDIRLTDQFLQPHLEDIREMRSAVIHYGWIGYSDVFGERHRTNFAFYHRGKELSDEASKRCRFGNSAT
jgi:hypothetical protein